MTIHSPLLQLLKKTNHLLLDIVSLFTQVTALLNSIDQNTQLTVRTYIYYYRRDIVTYIYKAFCKPHPYP